jgi:hypothetical protein
MATKTRAPGWSDAKTLLADFDHDELVGLIRDLYAASKENKAFMHARLGLGDDTLKPYKETISRWISPDVYRDQRVSVSAAKKAISDYKRAVGHPKGMAELMIFFCEEAVGFSRGMYFQEHGYFLALVRMFEQAIIAVSALPDATQIEFLIRLNQVRNHSVELGYGVDEAMDQLFLEYGLEDFDR